MAVFEGHREEITSLMTGQDTLANMKRQQRELDVPDITSKCKESVSLLIN